MVDLDRAARILGRRLRDVEPDLFDVRRRARHALRALDGAEDSYTPVEPAGDRGVLQLLVEWPGEVRMQVVRAEAAATRAQFAVVGMERSRPDDDRMRFILDIEQPHQLGRVFTVVL